VQKSAVVSLGLATLLQKLIYKKGTPTSFRKLSNMHGK
jgi:hypothetical protein